MSETSSNVAYPAVPTHVMRQHYLVTPAGLARLKGLDLQTKKEAIIIEIFNKKD
jgi:acyl-CoA hydrolase